MMLGEKGWGRFSTPSFPLAGLKPVQECSPILGVFGMEVSRSLEESGEPGLSVDNLSLLALQKFL